MNNTITLRRWKDVAVYMLVVFFISPVFAQRGQVTKNRRSGADIILKKAIVAMGGDSWSAVTTLRMEGYGNQNTVDQSERWEGPYIPGQITRKITKNFVGQSAMVEQNALLYNFKSQNTFLFDSGYVAEKFGPQIFPTQQAQELQVETELSPEVVLQKAAKSADITYLRDTTLQQTAQHILYFKWQGYPVRIFINSKTYLITAIEVTKPFQNDLTGLWGDTKKITFYSFWMLLAKGLHYPLQQDSYVNGWYRSSFIINKWEVNPIIAPDSLKIPKNVRFTESEVVKKFDDKLRQQLEKPAEKIAEGISVYHGPCNSTVIEQTDGLVIIEGPHSSTFTKAIAGKIRDAYPGKRIKALVSTSDAWLHVGGIRTFASIQGIKIYYPYRNRPLLEKLLKARYVTYPDDLEKNRKHSYTLIGVKDSLMIGSGRNRLVLYPYDTETGERMMMAYFPGKRILYASDLYQPKDANGNFWQPHMELEVYQSIRKLRIPALKFYSMHSSVIPYSELENDFKGY